MQFDILTLENFQCHELERIAFSPTITSLVGSSDAGKSAIIRAIRYISLNDLAGAGFVTHGEKECAIALRVADEGGVKTITRTRGSNANQYQLDKKDFVAFGAGKVPDEIAQTLNVSELNFQGQFDAPFWFSLSAPEVSRQLNSVIDLSVIDTALSNVGRAVSTAQERERLCRERLTAAQSALKELEPQRPRVAQFANLKRLNEEHQTLADDCHQLEEILGWAGACDVGDLQARAHDALAVLDHAGALVQVTGNTDNLFQLLDEAAGLQNAAQPPPPLKPVEQLCEEWIDLEKASRQLEGLLMAGNYHSVEISEREADAEAAEIQFHKITKGTICPLCNKTI